MPTTEDYAVLSTRVYNINSDPLNYLTLPSTDGWSELATANDPTSVASGLVAQAFRRNDDIVIAFKGVDSSGEKLWNDFLHGALPGAFGIGGDQLDAAALFYQQIRQQYAGQNVKQRGM